MIVLRHSQPTRSCLHFKQNYRLSIFLLFLITILVMVYCEYICYQNKVSVFQTGYLDQSKHLIATYNEIKCVAHDHVISRLKDHKSTPQSYNLFKTESFFILSISSQDAMIRITNHTERQSRWKPIVHFC